MRYRYGEYSRVKRHPFDIIKQHQPARNKQLPEILDINPFVFIPLEIYPRVLEELDRVGRIHVVSTTTSAIAPTSSVFPSLLRPVASQLTPMRT